MCSLFFKLKFSNFKSCLTLSYPKNCVVNKSQIIEFIKYLNLTIYFYVYEISKKSIVHILLFSDRDFSLLYFSLVPIWGDIIKSTRKDLLKHRKLSKSLLLHVVEVFNKQQSSLRVFKKRLGFTRCVGGSLHFSKLLVKTKKKKKTFSLEKICHALSSDNIDQSLLIEQIILELQYNSKAIFHLNFEELELFLQKSKRGFDYFRVLKSLLSLSKNHIDFLISFLSDWRSCKKRFSIFDMFLTRFLPTAHLLTKCLDFLIKSSCQRISCFDVCESLGFLLFSEIGVGIDVDATTNSKFFKRIGLFVISLINRVFDKKLFFRIKNSIYFFWFDKNIFPFTRNQILLMFETVLPMLIPPKPWSWLREDLVSGFYVDANKVNNGGLVLNGLLFQKSFQRYDDLYRHDLQVHKNCVITVNLLQETEFTLNDAQFDLIRKYKRFFPDFLNRNDLKTIQLSKRMQLLGIKDLLYDRQRAETKISDFHKLSNPTNLHIDIFQRSERELVSIKRMLVECKSVLFRNELQLTRHRLFLKVLKQFSKLRYNYFFYSYDTNFELNLRPQQDETSPQSNEMTCSLVHFREVNEFNLDEFILYSTRIYSKEHTFDKTFLIESFHSDVKPLLNKFMVDELHAVQSILRYRPNPFLFLAAACEYKKYIECTKTGLTYYTGFPIILECNFIGFQIVNLFFSSTQFTKSLNLTPGDKYQNFYISVIELFLLQNVVTGILPYNVSFLPFICKLYEICKSSIIIQLYGGSFRIFCKELEKKFNEYKSDVRVFLNPMVEFLSFIHSFAKSFFSFLQKLDLFRLPRLLSKMLTNIRSSVGWKMLDVSRVHLRYGKIKKYKLDFKESVLGRTSIFVKETTLNFDLHKQKFSFQSNYIRCLQGFIHYSLLNACNFPVYQSSDFWAVGTGYSSEFRKYFSEVFFDLSNNSKFIIKSIDFVSEKSLEKISYGKYNSFNLKICSFLVYFGR